MESVIRLRKQFSQQLLDVAQTRREAVWDTVESRVQQPGPKFSIFRRLSGLRGNRATVPSLEGLPVAQTAWHATGTSSQQVIEAARRRRALARMRQDASVHSESRVWSLVRSRLTARNAEPAPEGSSVGWPRLALAGAAVALLIAAVGPLPSAGLAHHPAIGLVDFIGDKTGVRTDSAPPTAVPPADVLQGIPATVEQASEVLGLRLSEPSDMDQRGYQQASSMLFARGVTAANSGVFVLTYASPDATVTILQEAAGSASMNAPEGAARTVTLADGTPAVLIDGGWDQGSTGLQPTSDGQQLVFERHDVRTIIIENGTPGDASLLVDVADSMTPATQG